MSNSPKFQRVDQVRSTLWLQNKPGNHSHLQDHKRPMLSHRIDVAEEITITFKPGIPTYFPALFCNVEKSYTEDSVQTVIPADTSRPVYSGGIKTK